MARTCLRITRDSGRKPYEELPAYCREFDVGLIPFKINDLTLAVNPIRLREYLAAGLPVVSTPLPEVRLCEEQIEIVDAADEFVAAVERSLNICRFFAVRLSESMQAETWPEKAETISGRFYPDRVIR